MELGAHLPLIDFGDGPLSAADLTSYARRCVGLGYTAIAANDHLVFPRPWLDGLTALATVASLLMELGNTSGSSQSVESTLRLVEVAIANAANARAS